jgi:hypothetical protein
MEKKKKIVKMRILSDCDCDKTVEVHRNTIEGKIIRKQRKSVVKNLEIYEVNKDLIQVEVKKNLVNEKIVKLLIRKLVSKRQNRNPINRNKDFLWVMD